MANRSPSSSKVNPADCVDMDCDAKKKALLKDLDGLFLGAVGAVVPQSEYEWDGDPRRGLGDYRIPKVMLTFPNGTRIPVNQIAPRKGNLDGKVTAFSFILSLIIVPYTVFIFIQQTASVCSVSAPKIQINASVYWFYSWRLKS